MACFLVPGAEAIVVTAAEIILRKRYEKKSHEISMGQTSKNLSEERLPFYKKLRWLMSLLWGGVVLLAFEHIWHGEVQPFFPFLTGAATPEGLSTILQEMASVGSVMALLVTAVWVGMLIISFFLEKKTSSASKEVR